MDIDWVARIVLDFHPVDDEDRVPGLVDEMEIKPLSMEHYDAMIRVWKAAGLPHRPDGRDSRTEMERQISEFGDLILGAFEKDELVGVIVGTDDGRKGWINRLAVHPEHLRRGVGLNLIRAIENALRERGKGIISVLIESPNEPSVALFEKAGYSVWKGMIYMSKRDDPDV